MSASDGRAGGPGGAARPAARTRASARLVIRRDDHAGDSLGFVFLEAGVGNRDGVIERLREYLGPRVRIIKAEVSAEQIEVEVSARRFAEEAARMAEAAEGLRRKGALRSAESLFKETLELDPLNVAALRGRAAMLARREDYAAAFRMVCRAREAGGDNVEMLHEMGRLAAAMGRVAAAIAYLERACELAPDNFAIRRALADLGRKPPATLKLKARAAMGQGPRKRDGAG